MKVCLNFRLLFVNHLKLSQETSQTLQSSEYFFNFSLQSGVLIMVSMVAGSQTALTLYLKVGEQTLFLSCGHIYNVEGFVPATLCMHYGPTILCTHYNNNNNKNNNKIIISFFFSRNGWNSLLLS